MKGIFDMPTEAQIDIFRGSKCVSSSTSFLEASFQNSIYKTVKFTSLPSAYAVNSTV